MDAFGNVDSKYRFIIIAAKRAKQLLKGAKPKVQGRSKNPIRIAQTEVRNGLIEYEIIPARIDEVPEREERVFVGGGIPDEAVESDGLAVKDVEGDVEVEPGEEHEEEGADEENGEEEDAILKDDKDD
ncbi:MAG: DNA-directed RNA polymerase subunit omega [Candidatus Aminicenantales bacterium]